MSYDIIVVGSGHNGMIAAAYLARAGLKVGVFERRPFIGGAVCTQDDIIPGYRIDVGSSAHVMIHQTPIAADLDLARHGLDYIEMDPWASSPNPETGETLHFWKDVDRTCESISRFSDRDAEAYARFCEAWGDLNEGVFDVVLRSPTPWNILRSMFGRSLKGSDRLNMIRLLMAPYGQLVTETFEHESLRTAMIWLAAQSGPPPSEAASGDFAGWHSMYHRSGMKRARGGSGALTQALRSRILADGGDVIADAPVSRIVTNASGRVTGIELEGGERHEARVVLAACHIKTTVETLLRDAPLPERIRRRTRQLRIGNGFGMIVRCAVDSLPRYRATEFDAQGCAPIHRGLQLLCPSRRRLDEAYADYLGGRTPEKPVPLAMTFSALDDSLAPPGKHTLFVWGQYHPYELSNGESWDNIADREADKLLAAVDEYAPGTSASVTERFIQTPLSIEQMHGMHRGNVMHLEMSFDQMFLFRPMPELSGYRMPLSHLYITGASTHPGGGVWGASGHNVAKVILSDRKRWK